MSKNYFLDLKFCPQSLNNNSLIARFYTICNNLGKNSWCTYRAALVIKFTIKALRHQLLHMYPSYSSSKNSSIVLLISSLHQILQNIRMKRKLISTRQFFFWKLLKPSGWMLSSNINTSVFSSKETSLVSQKQSFPTNGLQYCVVRAGQKSLYYSNASTTDMMVTTI